MPNSILTSHRRTIVWIALVSAVGAGFVLFRYFEPTEQSFFPKCQLHQMTGLHCPGCGSTRAIHALVHGRWKEAVQYNPLIVFGFPLLIGGVGYHYRCERRETERRETERRGTAMNHWFPLSMVMLMLVYFVARNVPSPQRSWLAPPTVAPPTVAAPTVAPPTTGKDIERDQR